MSNHGTNPPQTLLERTCNKVKLEKEDIYIYIPLITIMIKVLFHCMYRLKIFL